MTQKRILILIGLLIAAGIIYLSSVGRNQDFIETAKSSDPSGIASPTITPASDSYSSVIASPPPQKAPSQRSTSGKTATTPPPVTYGYRIINTYPHDIQAFTEGLIFQNGQLYESTGLEGQSTVRVVDLTTGKILKTSNLSPEIFGEGIALFDGKIIQVSWKNQWAFVYNQKTLQKIKQFQYPMAEGWGLTYDGRQLIMSDGSATLYFLDKNDFSETRRIEVHDPQGPVLNINELEYIEGEIWANIWQTNYLVRIDPATGAVLGQVNLTGLLKPQDQHPKLDVLNGIAYEKAGKRIFVTGKNWPKLFEIEVIRK